jgi:hypothetical protein
LGRDVRLDGEEGGERVCVYSKQRRVTINEAARPVVYTTVAAGVIFSFRVNHIINMPMLPPRLQLAGVCTVLTMGTMGNIRVASAFLAPPPAHALHLRGGSALAGFGRVIR